MKINISVQFVCIVNAGREETEIYIQMQVHKKDLTHCYEIILTPRAKTNITIQRAACNRISCSHKLLFLRVIHTNNPPLWIRCVVQYHFAAQ